MNLGTLRLRVAQTLNVAQGANVNSTASGERDLLDGYINEGVEQVLLRTKVNKKTASVALTAGVGDYTLDPIMLSFDDMWISPASNPSWLPMLEPLDTYDIRAMRNLQSVVASPTIYYAFEGNVIMLYPLPAAGDTLHIVYVPRPTAMTNQSHDPSQSPYGELPSEFHTVVEDYAKWKMADYADDGSSQIGAKYQTDYEGGIIRIKTLLVKKGGVRTGRAQVGRRGKNALRYAPPGVDIRG